jgi:hypothetical protein
MALTRRDFFAPELFTNTSPDVAAWTSFRELWRTAMKWVINLDS